MEEILCQDVGIANTSEKQIVNTEKESVPGTITSIILKTALAVTSDQVTLQVVAAVNISGPLIAVIPRVNAHIITENTILRKVLVAISADLPEAVAVAI